MYELSYTRGRVQQSALKLRGGSLFYVSKSIYLGVLKKGGGGGYPQALPKVINLQGMLDLPKILVLIEKLPPRS